MAQQYYPSVYNGPRYAGQALGVPYVSAYDPSATGRYVDLMQQEYAKAFSANQALAQRQSEIADIFSYDQEGKEAVLGGYKQKINKIKEAYNQDLALAAPELARAVVEERANPWYAKNVLYNKEYERRQKLLDQFGPNIQFAKDLPQGNLNDIEMGDIGFEYLNKAILDDMLQREYGPYAKQVRYGNLQQLKDFPAFAERMVTKGLTADEAAALTEDEINQYALASLQGSGTEASPELADLIRTHASQWAQANLVGGYEKELKQIASLSGSGNGTENIGLPENSLLVPLEQTIPATPTRKEARKSGIDIMDRSQTGELTYEEEMAINEDTTLKERINNSPLYTAFNTSIPNLIGDLVSEEVQSSVISELRNSAMGASSANDAIISALENAGVVEYSTMTTPQGIEGSITWNGKDITKAQLQRKVKDIAGEFRDLRKYNNSPEGIKLAKDVTATVNKPVATNVYGISAEGNADTKTYINDVILAGNAANLVDYGAYMTDKDESKSYDPKKSQRRLEDLQDPKKDKELGAVTYKESGGKGEAAELILETNQGDLHLPLKNEQGYQHGMQLSLITQDPRIVNDVFTSMYDKILSEGGGSVPLEDIFGNSELENFGLTDIYRNDSGGTRKYIAPVHGEYQIEASTPNALLLKIAAYVNTIAQQQQMVVNNPTLAFMMKRVSQLRTPKETKEAYYSRIGQLQ